MCQQRRQIVRTCRRRKEMLPTVRESESARAMERFHPDTVRGSASGMEKEKARVREPAGGWETPEAERTGRRFLQAPCSCHRERPGPRCKEEDPQYRQRGSSTVSFHLLLPKLQLTALRIDALVYRGSKREAVTSRSDLSADYRVFLISSSAFCASPKPFLEQGKCEKESRLPMCWCTVGVGISRMPEIGSFFSSVQWVEAFPGVNRDQERKGHLPWRDDSPGNSILRRREI